MHIFTRAAGCAAMGFFVFGCTGDTSNSTTTSGAGTGSTGSGGDAGASIIDTYCQALEPPLCEAGEACGWLFGPAEPADRIQLCKDGDLYPGKPNFCSAQRLFTEYLEASLQSGMTIFDQAQFDACLARFKSMLVGGEACTERTEHIADTDCLNAFRGQGMPGDACPVPGDLWEGYWTESALSCKAGRCENSVCVPFLKIGDACNLQIAIHPVGTASANLECNFLNKEVCWGAPGSAGAGGGGGDAGAAEVMGTCRPQAEIGEACDPGNRYECKSHRCDMTGKCVLP
jgi:hypothetical protein